MRFSTSSWDFSHLDRTDTVYPFISSPHWGIQFPKPRRHRPRTAHCSTARRWATASSSLRMWAGAALCQHFSAGQQPRSPSIRAWMAGLRGSPTGDIARRQTKAQITSPRRVALHQAGRARGDSACCRSSGHTSKRNANDESGYIGRRLWHSHQRRAALGPSPWWRSVVVRSFGIS